VVCGEGEEKGDLSFPFFLELLEGRNKEDSILVCSVGSIRSRVVMHRVRANRDATLQHPAGNKS
jgi:hypothetical protein